MSDELKDKIYHLTTERDEWHLRCEQAQAEIARLREALSSLKWQSIDKDNMEFKAVVNAWQMNDIRAALKSDTGETPKSDVAALERAWSDFCDANPDDLTSSEDLPDHALMTCEQFVKYALAALKPDTGEQP